MRNDRKPIDGRIPRSLSIRQAESTSESLFGKGIRRARSKRNDGIEIVHVPSLLKHHYLNDDFYWIIVPFDFQEFSDRLISLVCLSSAHDLYDLIPIVPIEEFLGLDK